MIKKTAFLFIFLALVALLLIDFDYVCGHMSENPFKPNECPLCAAFQSTELGDINLLTLLAFGLIPIIGFLTIRQTISPLATYISTYSLRAPPSF